MYIYTIAYSTLDLSTMHYYSMLHINASPIRRAFSVYRILSSINLIYKLSIIHYQ